MSSSNTGPGGVRNLRAMFETKGNDQSNSPPSRGRSPNESTPQTQDRPLSKVRASFVAVEKPEKDKESPSSPHKKSESTMDGTSHNITQGDQGLGQILKGSPFLDDGQFPSVSKQDSETNGVGDRAAAMVKKMQQNTSKPPPVGHYVDTNEGPKVKPIGPSRQINRTPAQPQPPTEASKSPVTPKGPVVKPRGGVSKIQGVMESASRAQEARDAAASESVRKAETSKSMNSTNPISQAKPRVSSVAQDTKLKSANSRSLGETSIVTTTKDAATKPSSEITTRAEPSRAVSATKPPRMSLPVRKVPASAPAPATSSAAKKDDSRTSQSKSTNKAPLRVANAGTASSLAKKSSRASLSAHEGVKSKPATKPADEGFLARMMRPTASSAQKSHDKVQIDSPPRPKPAVDRTVSTKSSRKSLHRTGEDKENEA